MADDRSPNALLHERSPYLLQHAHNPVRWLPWGDEAFEAARASDRPVFLSIGYSACHWCHVMERESFEDPVTAAALSADFVCVKVDREERPDIDRVYQLAYQAISGRGGGWPLSMFLTPDRKPFTGGTYFPNERRHGMPSFREVLGLVREAWRERRSDVVAQSDALTEALDTITDPRAPDAPPSRDSLRTVVATLLRKADRTLGGFGSAPKFPNTMSLDLLVAHAAFAPGAEDAREAAAFVCTTLDAMARGGIFDHLGGGFARYSTDREWRVPHFEKMLYDNAQLARLYLDGARLIGARDFEAVTRSVLTWTLREMTSPGGCFYSAQDADSEGEEGRFFAWNRDEVRAAVGDDAAAVCAWFDVTPEGNFEHGRSVLWTPRPPEVVARSLGATPDALAAVIARCRPALFAAREARVHPALDDKCLAAWNGQMISSLADAGATLEEPAWVAAAERALARWRTMGMIDRRLAHAIKGEEPYGQGFLDDHGALCCAAIDVYEATGGGEALAFARTLGAAIVAGFVDDATGELYFAAHDAEVVLCRSRDPHDHAYPGGTGLACDALLRLGALTGVAGFTEVAARCLGRFAAVARDNPMGLATVARAVDRLARGSVEVVILGDRARDDTRAMVRAARGVMVPHRVLITADTASAARTSGIAAALVEGRGPAADGAPVGYVCRNGACGLPVTQPEGLIEALRAAVCG